jgi:hypothetical protein
VYSRSVDRTFRIPGLAAMTIAPAGASCSLGATVHRQPLPKASMEKHGA